MQKNHSAFKNIIWLLTIVIGVASLINLSSCKVKKNDVTCVKLTKAQLKKWATKGYITAGDTTTIVRIKAAYGFPGTIFKVYAGVQQPNGSLIEASIIELTPVDTCNKSHINLDNYVFSGSLQVSVADWDIWKSDSGNTISDSLKYIQLEPYDYDYDYLPLLAFHDYVVTKSGIRVPVQHFTPQKMTFYSILPCPPCPNCKSPCPPPSSCPDPCSAIQIDSSAAQ